MASVRWEGWLLKKGEAPGSDFKRRYFTLLDNNVMQYWAPPSTAVDESAVAASSLESLGFAMRGSIDTSTAINVRVIPGADKGRHCLELVLPARTYNIAANNAGEADMLVEMLRVPVVAVAWANKLGKLHRSWKRRYFVLLSSRKLVYFKSEHWENDKPLGQIILKPTTVIRLTGEGTEGGEKAAEDGGSGRSCIEIVTPGRVWCIDHGDAQRNLHWTSLLSQQLHERVQPPFRVFLCGPPGSGKTSQCAHLARQFGIRHISTGDMLKKHIRGSTKLGREAKAHVDSGNLVPDDVVIDMVAEELRKPQCVETGFVLDGFPRTIDQALALRRHGVVPNRIVQLELSEAVLQARVTGRRIDPATSKLYHTSHMPRDPEIAARLRARPDDAPEKFIPRLKAFSTYIPPILTFYAAVVSRISGEEDEGTVAQAMGTIMAQLRAEHEEVQDQAVQEEDEEHDEEEDEEGGAAESVPQEEAAQTPPGASEVLAATEPAHTSVVDAPTAGEPQGVGSAAAAAQAGPSESDGVHTASEAGTANEATADEATADAVPDASPGAARAEALAAATQAVGAGVKVKKRSTKGKVQKRVLKLRSGDGAAFLIGKKVIPLGDVLGVQALPEEAWLSVSCKPPTEQLQLGLADGAERDRLLAMLEALLQAR